MNPTHKYKLEISGNEFTGDVEMNNAGVVSYTETSTEKMGVRIRDSVMNVFNELSVLPETYDDLVSFEYKIKE